MQKSLIVLILLAGIAAIYFLQPTSAPESTVEHSVSQHGLPWQIELSNGNSRVFDITLGVSTLANAIAAINLDYELAIMSKYQQTGALELFYPYFKAGRLKGKLIVVVDADEARLASLKSEAVSGEMLDNGTKKYQLSKQQFLSVQQLPIRSITFAPTARLNQEMIEQRFGAAESTIATTEHVIHFLYPERGLDILIDDKGKDLLQYVAPKSFPALHQRTLVE